MGEVNQHKGKRLSCL